MLRNGAPQEQNEGVAFDERSLTPEHSAFAKHAVFIDMRKFPQLCTKAGQRFK